MSFIVYQGLKATIPTLGEGEIAWATDTQEFFCGSVAGGNILIGSSASGGGGDVVGPLGATDGNFAAFDTTTGKLIKDSTYDESSFATSSHEHAIEDLTNVSTAPISQKYLYGAGPSSSSWQFLDAVNMLSAADTMSGARIPGSSAYRYNCIDFEGINGISVTRGVFAPDASVNAVTVTIDGSGAANPDQNLWLTFTGDTGTTSATSTTDTFNFDGQGGITCTVGTANITVTLENTGVIGGAYTNADITVDQQGRITAAASGTSGAGSIEDLTDSAAANTAVDFKNTDAKFGDVLINGNAEAEGFLYFHDGVDDDGASLSFHIVDSEFSLSHNLLINKMNSPAPAIVQLGYDSTDIGSYIGGGGRLMFGSAEYIQHNNTIPPTPPDWGVSNALEASTDFKVSGDIQCRDFLYLEANGGSTTGIFMGPEEVSPANIPRFYYDTGSQEFTANRLINLTSVKAADTVSVPFEDDINVDVVDEQTTDAGVTVEGVLIKDGAIPEAVVTAHEGAIDHDELFNFVAEEHIDWSDVGQTASLYAANVSTTNDVLCENAVKGETFYLNPGATSPGITNFYFRGATSDIDGLIYFLHSTDEFTFSKAVNSSIGFPTIISQLTADSSPTSDDYVMTHESTGGTNRKVLLSDLPSGSSAFADEAERVVEEVSNTTGSTLTAGDPVYISGYNVGLDLVNVAPAEADTGNMPALGLVVADISTGSQGLVVMNGSLHNIDTSSWTTGDSLYVSATAGVLTTTRPTGATTEVQKVGTVLRSHATLGSVFVTGANRSNDVPNIADGKFWQGNSSGVATEVQLQESLMVQIEGTVDEQIQYVVPFDIQITGWTMLLDASGSMQVDVWKDTYANHPPTDADSWVTPLVTSAAKNQATGLSLTASAGDILIFNVDSVATATLATVALTGVRTS